SIGRFTDFVSFACVRARSSGRSPAPETYRKAPDRAQGLRGLPGHLLGRDGEAQLGEPTQKRGERDRDSAPGLVRGRAMMPAGAEREVPTCRPVRVEPAWLGMDGRIVVGRAEGEDHQAALLDELTAQHEVLGGASLSADVVRAAYAQKLVDDVRDAFRMCGEQVEVIRVRQ